MRTFIKGKKQQVRNKYPGLMMGPQNEESVVAEAYRSLRTTSYLRGRCCE